MDARSESNLKGVHPDLVKVVRAAATKVSFIVIDGVRTVAEERANVAKGASQTLRSRHLPGKDGFAHAVDVMAMPAGHASWDRKDYQPIGVEMKAVGRDLSIPITWGGDWTTLKDWGHFELPEKTYP